MNTESKVIDPLLTDIVNMNLTKKDIMEIIEVDYRKELNNKINDVYSKLKNLNKSIELSMNDLKNKIEEIEQKILSIFSKKHSIKAENLRIYEEKIYKNNVVINIMFTIKNYTINDYDKQAIDYYIINKTEIKEITKISSEISKIENERNTLKEQYDVLNEELENINKTIKEFSATITKKALENSAQGNQILSLINSIRQNKQKLLN